MSTDHVSIACTKHHTAAVTSSFIITNILLIAFSAIFSFLSKVQNFTSCDMICLTDLSIEIDIVTAAKNTNHTFLISS